MAFIMLACTMQRFAMRHTNILPFSKMSGGKIEGFRNVFMIYMKTQPWSSDDGYVMMSQTLWDDILMAV